MASCSQKGIYNIFPPVDFNCVCCQSRWFSLGNRYVKYFTFFYKIQNKVVNILTGSYFIGATVGPFELSIDANDVAIIPTIINRFSENFCHLRCTICYIVWGLDANTFSNSCKTTQSDLVAL